MPSDLVAAHGPADARGTPIVAGSIVAILGKNNFTGEQGIVVDAQSDKDPNDGPLAVFFDREVPTYRFNVFDDDDWRRGLPTKENYRKCPRVICFLPDEVEVRPEFDIEVIVRRDFGNNYNSLYGFNFPLVRNTHQCQMRECGSGLLASEKTIINVWGSLNVVYTCGPCHTKWHGRRCDSFELKNPLPGKP